MRFRYRAEPGRLVLSLEDMDLADRLPADPARFLRLALGAREVIVPPPLDWDLQDAFAPIQVLADPAGRTWEPLMWSDTGRTAELWTPQP